MAAVERAVASRPYLWANLVLIDRHGQAAIEVRSRRTAVLRPDRPTARSNHHTALGVHPDNDDRLTTLDRIASAQARLDRAASLDDILELLRSHDQGDTGVCNHLGYSTVYSYLLRHQAGTTTLMVSRGRPCEGSPRVEMELPFGPVWSPGGVENFLAAYPSDRVRVS